MTLFGPIDSPTLPQGPKWEKEESEGDLAHIERARVLMVNRSFLNGDRSVVANHPF